jgi:hypothetical protein
MPGRIANPSLPIAMPIVALTRSGPLGPGAGDVMAIVIA